MYITTILHVSTLCYTCAVYIQMLYVHLDTYIREREVLPLLTHTHTHTHTHTLERERGLTSVDTHTHTHTHT